MCRSDIINVALDLDKGAKEQLYGSYISLIKNIISLQKYKLITSAFFLTIQFTAPLIGTMRYLARAIESTSIELPVRHVSANFSPKDDRFRIILRRACRTRFAPVGPAREERVALLCGGIVFYGRQILLCEPDSR